MSNNAQRYSGHGDRGVKGRGVDFRLLDRTLDEFMEEATQ